MIMLLSMPSVGCLAFLVHVLISEAAATSTCSGLSCTAGSAWLQRASLMKSGKSNKASIGFDLREPVQCPQTGEGQKTGTLTSAINELSGLAASRKNAGFYWGHNDSGGRARIFAIDVHGKRKKTVNMDSAGATDWEDIATGPGPVPGESYIYIADIGDNSKHRGTVQIYRVPEPKIEGNEWEDIHVMPQRFEVAYPSGARDCETIFVDQGPAAVAQGTAGRVYIITKHYDYQGDVYWVDLPAAPSGTLTFTKESMLNHGGSGWPSAVTAADINPQGTYIAVRAYDQLIMYPRQDGSSVEQALQGQGCPVSRKWEKQGEAVTFGSDGSHYITIGEGRNPPVWYFTLGMGGEVPGLPKCGDVALSDVDLHCPLTDGSGCKVLANHMRHKTCRDYCTKNGLGCVNGWEEENENCVVKVDNGLPVELGCDESYGSTSDLLCQCKP